MHHPATAFYISISVILASSIANATHFEEMTVYGSRERVAMERTTLDLAMPDSAELMQRVPGGDVNKNGALSGIPQYRGMYGARVQVQANGLAVSPGGPNWMDPPLHYTPAALLDSFVVFRGIAPVSAGQETIGGAIHATTWQGDFADTAQWQQQGLLYSGIQSNNDGWVSAIGLAATNQNHKLYASALTEAADDQSSAEADITPSEYDRERYELGYSIRLGHHQFSISGTRNYTNDSGTPALPMDILYVDGDAQKLAWQFDNARWWMQATLANNNIEHGMTNYHLRTAPADLARWRRNETGSDTRTAHFKIGRNLDAARWSAGLDHQLSLHNSDISNPNNAMFYIANFNNVRRRLRSAFSELQWDLSSAIQLDLGLRASEVDTDAGRTDSSMAAMNPMVAALRDNFNQSQRAQSDTLIDAVAKLHIAVDERLSLYTALARKSRAPAYQERYLWLPMQSTAGLADGNNHVGDVALEAEVAHELEWGIDFQDDNLMLSPRLFYKHIDDYIQGVPSDNPTVISISTMMGGDASPLAFANTSAKIYGADLEASWQLNHHWSLGTIASVIRGERRDIDDDLYRIAPDMLTLSLTYQGHDWSTSLINALHRAQNRVSTTNEEAPTSGYGLVHLHSQVALSKQVHVSVGINNLLDKQYQNHLAGYNRAMNPDLAIGERLPGAGRDIFARIKWEW